MNRLIAVAGAVVVVLVAIVGIEYFAQGVKGSGELRTEVFELAPFDHLALEGVGVARVEVGEPQQVRITTDDNVLPLLSVAVEAGGLTIRARQEIRPSELSIEIRAPWLRGVALWGNPTVVVPGVADESFEVGITGHGTVELGGRTDHLTVRIFGNGRIRARDLQARRAVVDITGAGDVELHAIDDLAVKCTGSGSVRYAGEPRLTTRGDASVVAIE